MSIRIRPLQTSDFPAWLPLWNGNNREVKNEAVTTETWSRLTNPDFPVFGLCADQGGALLGLTHYVLHYTTGHIQPVCYMQDVYVDPAQRQQGIGRKLVREVTKIAKREQWGRLYWIAQNDNEDAQALYKSLGIKLNFSLHIMPLD